MVKVYYSFIDERFRLTNNLVDGLPACRREYVNRITDIARKRQSVLVWKLLEYAVKDYAGKTADHIEFFHDGKKFSVKNYPLFFSLSHSHEALVAMVSAAPCGVDVEMLTEKFLRCEKKIINLSGQSVNVISDCDKKTRLAEIWTAYECKIKSGGEYETKFVKLKYGGSEYMLAFSAEKGLCGASINCVKREDFLGV